MARIAFHFSGIVQRVQENSWLVLTGSMVREDIGDTTAVKQDELDNDNQVRMVFESLERCWTIRKVLDA